MSALFLKIVNMSISASWLILAVLLLRLVLKKAPKWVNVLLWGIVALRLLFPFSIESALSLIPSAETIPADITMDTTPAIDSGINAINSVVNPMISHSNTPAVGASVNPLQITVSICACIWLLGAAALLVYTAVSYWRLRKKIGTAVLFRDNIFQSEHVSSPFVLGIIKPKIYLPFQMDRQDMEHVIAHELAHIRRRDHWWKPLGFLLLTIHWFNPLMWLAYVLLCRDIELACDEKVIRDLDSAQRADYTQALVSCSVSRRTVAACPLAFGEVGVKKRVKSVMNYKQPGFWLVALAVVLCVAVGVCFLTDPLHTVRNPWTQEYVPGTGNILGNVDKEKFESVSGDFAIGADQYGRAVFKDPHRALKALSVLYAEGIALIREENRLPPLSHHTYALYQDFGWQTTTGSPEAQSQASFVSGFLDIYENSFSEEIPLPNTEIPATEEGLWDTGIVAVSGGNTVPVAVFPAGTAIADIKDHVQWLDILPWSNGNVPFDILRDGEAQYGWYDVYDGETLEGLDFFRPSGLAPQTYIFGNGEYGHDYIVTLRSPEGDLLCFGARLPQSGLDLAALKDLVARYGEDLSWSHFYGYFGEDIGSGLYVMQYQITDADCCLLIGGGMESPPLYILLVSKSDRDHYIDVRYEDIDTFLSAMDK